MRSETWRVRVGTKSGFFAHGEKGFFQGFFYFVGEPGDGLARATPNHRRIVGLFPGLVLLRSQKQKGIRYMVIPLRKKRLSQNSYQVRLRRLDSGGKLL
jgi:hypothetical protein